MKYLYGIYCEGKLIDKGAAREIADKYESSIESVRSCCNNKFLFKRKYKIRKLGQVSHKAFQYYAFKDDILTFIGNKYDMAMAIKCTRLDIENAVRYGSIINGYIVTRKLVDGESIIRLKLNEEDSRELKLSATEKRFNYLVKHLLEYGNTCIGCISEYKVKEYMDMLAEKGIEATYRIVQYKDDLRQWYIVERK